MQDKRFTTPADIKRELRKPGDLYVSVAGAHDSLWMLAVKSDALRLVDYMGDNFSLKVDESGTKWLSLNYDAR